MRLQIFASAPEAKGLDAFAHLFFDLIGASDIEERDSSNYIEERYFRASANGATFRVAYSDDQEHSDELPFWITTHSSKLPPQELEGLVDRLVAERLIPAGFRLAKIANFGALDQVRKDYK